MFSSLVKKDMSTVQKICFAGLFIAVITILQKVIPLNNIIPFARISLGGCALLIFSSIFLGPWYGLLIGAASDALGFLIFDRTGLGFMPQITAIYAVMGFASYFIFKLITLIANKNYMKIIEYGLFTLLVGGIITYCWLNDEVNLFGKVYPIELWEKILITCLSSGLFVALIIVNKLTDKLYIKKDDSRLVFNPYQISFACLIIEVLVMVIFGSVMKGTAFGFDTFSAIVICQLICMSINVPINTIIISYILLAVRRLH